jgi:hypothetical protein
MIAVVKTPKYEQARYKTQNDESANREAANQVQSGFLVS